VTTQLPEPITSRLYALTGHTADLNEALDQWEHEQELVKDLYANYDLYRIHNTQLINVLQIANKLIQKISAETGLFIGVCAI